MSLNEQWFTEEMDGAAFSLKIKKQCFEGRSPYQHLAVYETETFGHLLVTDGNVQLTSRENFPYREMLSHPGLFMHPEPVDVVIIGGGDCGTLHEVLKHQCVRSAKQVEIDEQITRLAEEYFPELCQSNEETRAELIFADGIEWMANASDNSVDVIIIDSSDPVGPGVGLFRQSFYEDCRRVLRNDGVMTAQSDSPLLHPSVSQNMQSLMQQAGFAQTATMFFPVMAYPSGWWSATMAGNALSLDAFRESACQQRGFETQYYNEQIHRGAFAVPEFMRR